MDEEEDDDPPEEEEGDAFHLDPSEYKSIASSSVRKYFIPTLNFKAKTYPELIDWEVAKLTEPPLTLDLNETELLAIKETPFKVPDYPCYTQAVERGIKLISEASAAVIGQEAQEGFICQRIKER